MSKADSPLSLYCQTDQRYQWCYWEHNGTQYSTTAQDRTEFSPLFQWERTETSCGLLIPSAQPEHAGEWRCHLADTDQEEDSVKDERRLEVLVAVEARPDGRGRAALTIDDLDDAATARRAAFLPMANDLIINDSSL